MRDLQRSPLTSERETRGSWSSGRARTSFNGALSHRRGRRRSTLGPSIASRSFNGALSHRRGRHGSSSRYCRQNPSLQRSPLTSERETKPSARTLAKASPFNGALSHRRGRLIPAHSSVSGRLPSTEPSHIGEGDVPGLDQGEPPSIPFNGALSHRRGRPGVRCRQLAQHQPVLQRSPLTSERETSSRSGRSNDPSGPSTEPSHIGEGDYGVLVDDSGGDRTLQRSPLTSERETRHVRPLRRRHAPSTEPSHIGEGDARPQPRKSGSTATLQRSPLTSERETASRSVIPSRITSLQRSPLTSERETLHRGRRRPCWR